ncbi:MAG: PQQ-binding-like beta-propeller repeat protein [Acidobacteria bacterium]|nr:PQQ-binding-like beta-propeller repeat protein [Acidobacteriota bacterium]MYJ04322.1 PQQ-binding-like beta-propeller repeat protein [Acidobacteriota bacterium]
MLRYCPARRILLVVAAVLAVAAPAAAQSPDGEALFEEHCAACHLGDVVPRALAIDNMRAMTPAAIVGALTDGVMMQQGAELSPAERSAVAEFITGRTVEADAGPAAGACVAGSAADWAGLDGGAQWNGWGVDVRNARFQPAEHALLPAGDVQRLQLKWAFGYADVASAQSQPTVVGGRLFVASVNGEVYALDARTGCTYWTFSAQSGVRSAMTVARLADGRHALLFGDFNANVYALDAGTGEEIWRRDVDDHSGARITGAPVLHEDRLYVPVSSLEEVLAADPEYACCTFRGSVVALDVDTGDVAWKTYTIAETPAPRGRNPEGAFLMGPAGAAVWSAPTIDARRRLVYAATGNAYTEPAADTSDAIMAFDLDTGAIRWTRQFTPGDAFIICRPGNPNCPEESGPDFDFGASPVLVTMSDGRELLVVGQKSGISFGLDPDQDGAIAWQYQVGPGSALGGIEWGFAVDDEKAYFANSGFLTPEPGGLAAVRLRTGELVWYSEPHAPVCDQCSPALLAAITAIPGVVFSGAMDGLFRAYDADNGAVLWEFDTNGDHATVNGVPAKGGSINGPGPVVVDGMVYVNSGYAAFGGRGGNVLLAFGVD